MLPALPCPVIPIPISLPQAAGPKPGWRGVLLMLLATGMLASPPVWAAQAKAKAKHKAKPRAAVALDGDADAVTYGRRADAVALAQTLADKHGLDPAWVQAQLALARYQPGVARLIMPPRAGTAKNWAAYRARFIEPERIREIGRAHV